MQKETFIDNTECQLEVGNTTDEILLYYIDKYLEQENISTAYFSRLSRISAPTILEIRKSVRELSRVVEKKSWPWARSACRKKAVIIKIAVYTNMPVSDVQRALKFSGCAFNENSPIDMAILEWLSKVYTKRDISELNDLIWRKCSEAGFSEYEIERYMYAIPVTKCK